MADINRRGGRIKIEGTLRGADLNRFVATIHDATVRRGYQDITLDFSDCVAAFAPTMLGVCTQAIALRSRGVATESVLPKDETLKRLFLNTNWAYFLEPTVIAKSRFRGVRQVPATQFSSADEQTSVVDSVVEAVLGSIRGLGRHELAALEWSLNELTDNVLVHSRSEEGGLVQVTPFHSRKRRIEFVVCDAGVGVPATLRGGHPEIKSDSAALDRAIREGITRDQEVGQGNGLFGSFEICRMSGGSFWLYSGHASLSYESKKGRLHSRHENVPYTGTLVVVSIDCSQPDVLKHALKFGGRVHIPIDFIENKYESEEAGRVDFAMRSEASSVGSRAGGLPVRHKLGNIIEMCPGDKIFVDFDDIPIVSSSFADEVFGKLFVELGPLRFGQAVQFVNVSETVQQLIDRAITQRIAVK